MEAIIQKRAFNLKKESGYTEPLWNRLAQKWIGLVCCFSQYRMASAHQIRNEFKAKPHKISTGYWKRSFFIGFWKELHKLIGKKSAAGATQYSCHLWLKKLWSWADPRWLGCYSGEILLWACTALRHLTSAREPELSGIPCYCWSYQKHLKSYLAVLRIIWGVLFVCTFFFLISILSLLDAVRTEFCGFSA